MKSEWFGSKKASVWGLKVSLVVLLLDVIASGSNLLCCREASLLTGKQANVILPQERCKGRHKELHKDL